MDQHLDDIQYSLEYAPDTYDDFNPEAAGRWQEFSQDGKLRGVLWHDGENGVGFLMGKEDQIPGSSEYSLAMWNMLAIMKKQGVTAHLAHLALQQTPGATLGDVKTGQLKEAMALVNSLSDTAITAAGEGSGAGRVGPDATINAAFTLDSEEFIDLVRSDTVGLFIYDRGEWARLPDEDDTFDGTEWIELTDAGVARVEELLATGKTPTRDEMLKFSVDN